MTGAGSPFFGTAHGVSRDVQLLHKSAKAVANLRTNSTVGPRNSRFGIQFKRVARDLQDMPDLMSKNTLVAYLLFPPRTLAYRSNQRG